jgi:hypothetical protein
MKRAKRLFSGLGNVLALTTVGNGRTVVAIANVRVTAVATVIKNGVEANK